MVVGHLLCRTKSIKALKDMPAPLSLTLPANKNIFRPLTKLSAAEIPAPRQLHISGRIYAGRLILSDNQYPASQNNFPS